MDDKIAHEFWLILKTSLYCIFKNIFDRPFARHLHTEVSSQVLAVHFRGKCRFRFEKFHLLRHDSASLVKENIISLRE